jgi:pyruvate formate lyase activating enzyme
MIVGRGSRAMHSGSLRDRLARLTAAGELVQRLTQDRVRCVACGHRCVVLPGREGVCRVRFNEQGTLRVPRGYVAGLQVDPIEKKPFFHVLPGARALSFGMLGCDFHCAYCQNWLSSQSLRDPSAVAGFQEIEAGELASLAVQHGADVVTSTYNEPLITAEWAVEVFRSAKEAGLLCSFVSNGHGTPEVLDYLGPYLDLCKVDLKTFRDRSYRELGGSLERVLWTIRALHARGIWLEVVTLLVPGFNDSKEELRDIVRFIASVSPDLPWHVTAFHPDYRMTGPPATDSAALLEAASTGRAEGLRFVYAGNIPGSVGRWEDTSCPGCGSVLVERRGFRVLANRLRDGACPDCGRAVPGVWATSRSC